MRIDSNHVMSMQKVGVEYSFSDKDTIIYALGIGFGRDPLNYQELVFVYEKNLKAIPTMATVIAAGSNPDLVSAGINSAMVVHGEQRVKIFQPLPPSAQIVVDSRVVGLFDKGAEKGAVIVMETDIRLRESGILICKNTTTAFAKGNGGFSLPGQEKQGVQTAVHPIPDRPPDYICTLDTREDQALLYRLSGDRNPLHVDPEFAKAAGFERPILHGLCTYGMCCRAIVQTVCDHDASIIREFDARFSAPVTPGDELEIEIWEDDNIISFRAWVRSGQTKVIDNGRCIVTKISGKSTV